MRHISTIIATLLLPALGAGTLEAQDWPVYGGDDGGSRFSQLTQINRRNVATLETAWTYRTGDVDPNSRSPMINGFAVTPILAPDAAGGSLILCSAFNRIIALDPATGEERWVFDPKVERKPFGLQYKCRGVALWQDNDANTDRACAWRVFMNTADRRLISVDAKTGWPCEGFGENGTVDLTPIIESTVPANETDSVQFYSVPAVVGDTVVIGSTVGAKFRRIDAPSGAVRAFDARNGNLRWQFDPVHRGENDAPAPGSAPTGAGNVWSMMSVDQERDLLFLPTSSPSANFFGGNRPGDNRHTNSVVALNGSTGTLAWDYQIVHHDVWDYDLPAQPMLVTVTRNGASIPAVVQLTKQGFVFVFNRETGEPVFDIEERPVPTEGVPGEVLSPTQPFPVAPPPLIKQGVSPDDAWGFTFWDRAACRRMIEEASHGGMYRPPSVQGTVSLPGTSGGANWGGGAFDPERQLLVTAVASWPHLVRLIPEDELPPETFTSPLAGLSIGPPGMMDGTPYGFERRALLSPLGAPCTAPPWGSLVAVNLGRGTIEWSVPLGSMIKMLPVPIDLVWGMPNAGGPIITAGGLVFIGATPDEQFRAFDIETGKELWSAATPNAAMANPMTYAVDNRQLVVVAAGGHGVYYPQKISDHLVAFALPLK